MATKYTHLVVVCGHGTFRGSGDVWQESSWILQPFQQSDAAAGKPGEQFTFVQHVLCGAAILDQDPSALLVFSGGCTQNVINSTEAQSYLQVYKQVRGEVHEERVLCENLATDSYQNLLFALLEFRLRAGQYPERITVVTHAFKARRFLNCHASAIKWPSDRIRTIGIDPSFTLAEMNQVHWGENENAFKHFITDPYGIKPHLSGKRKKRGFDEKQVIQHLTNAALEESTIKLLAWSGSTSGSEIFPEALPWN